MNILFTCAGRRNYLLQYFKEALNSEGKIFAADSSSFAPALFEADRAFVVPNVSDPKYIDTLISICEENRVNLLISLNDLELPILAANFDRFRQIGTFPLVSSERVIDICFDKWKTVEYATKIGISTPKTFLTLDDADKAINDNSLRFPLVVKPRWGSASICVEYAEDPEELNYAYHLAHKRLFRSFLSATSSVATTESLLIQEKLTGTEYGLDILNDLEGNFAAVFIKEKISMRAGETDKAITRKNSALAIAGEKIARSLEHIGNLDCDFFVNEKGIFLLEMNPRFGGGYPFTHAAGANIPEAMVAWLRGEKADEALFDIKNGFFSAKCDRVIYPANGFLNHKEVS
ncbi:MAG: ATP-grasp domain-containing protein [Aminivibrio sp.]